MGLLICDCIWFGSVKSNMHLVQATKSGCGPVPWHAPELANSSYYNKHWAEQCNAFNQSVLQFIAQSPETAVIVLASAFRQYLAPNARRIVVRRAEGDVESEASIELQLLDYAALSKRFAGCESVLSSWPLRLVVRSTWAGVRAFGEQKGFAGCDFRLQDPRERSMRG